MSIIPIKQNGSQMCIPACVEMVIKYYFPSSPFIQDDIMKKHWEITQGCVPSDYNNLPCHCISFGSIQKVFDELSIPLIAERKGNKESDHESILKEALENVNKGTSVLLSLNLWANPSEKKPFQGSSHSWIKRCCHIVVLLGKSNDRIYFIDPACGNKEWFNYNFVLGNMSPSKDILIIRKFDK